MPDQSSSNCVDISVDQLHSWSLLGEFRAVLDKVAPAQRPASPKGGPKRLLTEEDYLSSILFTLFNPVIDSMRGLCACSDLNKVREEVTSRHISLGSFSEAQHVFGYERIEKVFYLLAEENRRLRLGPAAAQAPDISMVDSSVFSAVGRMEWAQWRHRHSDERAVRLHLKFHLFDAAPAGANITEGRKCERKALEEMIKPDEFYVGDRYYGRDYKMHTRFEQAGCRYIFRLSNDAHMHVIEELALDAEDLAEAVVYDRIVRLGARARWHSKKVRVILVFREGMEEPVLLVTNCRDRDRYSAALIAQIYRQRWSIELFFRWVKCTLGQPNAWHWLAESRKGVTIQLYAALIAALLLSRRMGKLPNKRSMEMIAFHAMGMVDARDIERVLKKALASRRKKSG